MRYWFTSPAPIIEEARLDDADRLAEIHAASFHRGWPAAEIETLIAADNVTALVARPAAPGPRPAIGFMLARTGADEAEVLTVAVDPRHRGRGIARALVEETTRRLYYGRVRRVFLEVDETNAPALTLYRRLGYVEVGRRGNYYVTEGGSTSNALVMRADLT